MHKIIFFPGIKILEKICVLPYLKFSDPLPETHLFFLFGLRSRKIQKNPTTTGGEHRLREWHFTATEKAYKTNVQ